ncbi:MAG: M15 family metallopeptidase [Planctomycetes bacterium]|nr:M15 family metallopeptidase [Planctomycetota bacterium]
MSLSERQQTFSIMVAKLIFFALQEGMALTFGEAFRTKEQQTLHLKSGKSRVRRSKHQARLAVDFNLFIDGKYVRGKEKYRAIGEKWEELGGRWGGRFGVAQDEYKTKVGWDAGHFEYIGT